MIGDVQDFIRRQLAVLPARWFSDGSQTSAQPLLLSAVLGGFGTAWSLIYGLLQDVQLLARIHTAFGPFLDMVATDFFGLALQRRPEEADQAFRVRILLELLRPRVTRASVIRALSDLTGQLPVIFEPARPADTGGYRVGGVGYCVAGGWGNLSLPYTSFVTAFRPSGGGIALLAGYDTGGYLAYGSLAMMQVQVTDPMIYAACAAVLPSGTVAWMRIENA